MLFSIVTPTRNALPDLKRCVASVRRQTDVELEHIVQDGDSTDGTREWLAEQAHLRWCSKADAGMYDAINQGLSRSSGDILGWINADEQYLPGALHTIAACFEKAPEVDMIFGDYIVVDTNGNAITARREIPFRMWYVVNGTLNIHSCALFFRRKIWERHGAFDPSYKIRGDREWLLRAATGGARITHIPEYLSLYTLRGTNLSYAPEAATESSRILERYKASACKPVRYASRLCRWTEKLAKGCYGTRRISYSVIDPHGTERAVVARVGNRWRKPRAPQS